LLQQWQVDKLHHYNPPLASQDMKYVCAILEGDTQKIVDSFFVSQDVVSAKIVLWWVGVSQYGQ
jgi:hypothetical protein